MDETLYMRVPDPEIALTPLGHEQAAAAGQAIRAECEAGGAPFRVYCYYSPYLRCMQTAAGVLQAFGPEQLMGVREEPQLREQDFANLQDDRMVLRKHDRNEFGKFFYRFQNGESMADVYDRVTIFEDHLVRDMEAGRFGANDAVIGASHAVNNLPPPAHVVAFPAVVTHGLTMRVFLSRWFHWTVCDAERVKNPENCAPLVLERRDALSAEEHARLRLTPGRRHTKVMYALSTASAAVVCAADPSLASMLDPRTDAASRLRASIEARVARRAAKAEAELSGTRLQGRRQDVTP